MWLVRSLLLFVAIAAIMAFAIVNVDHRTNLTVLTRTYVDLSLNVVLFCAAVAGALVTFLAMVWREFRLRASLRRLRRENMRLDDELTALRNLPISEPTQSGTSSAEG